jgi:hypothetical protein
MKNAYPSSDEDYLKELIDSLSFLSEATPRQMLAIKNIHSEMVYCSEYLAELIGASVDSLLGKKTRLSLYNDDPDFENILIREDQTIIEQRIPKIVFKVNNFQKGLLPYISMKSPLINPDTQNVVGILFQGLEQGVLSPQHYFSRGDAGSHINDVYENMRLTKREKQVIFFFLANLSSQEIAEMIYKVEGKRVSKSTIDGVFNDQLYLKFGVTSRVALYQLLQDRGYVNMVPKEILCNQSIFLETLKPY